MCSCRGAACCARVGAVTGGKEGFRILPEGRRAGLFFQGAEGFEDFAGGVEAGGAGEGDAGMRSRAAEKKIVDGSAIAREAEQRTHGEELVEGEFAVGDVAAGEAVVGFEIERRDDAASDDFRGEIGSVFGESFDDGVGESVALIFPIGWRPTFRG